MKANPEEDSEAEEVPSEEKEEISLIDTEINPDTSKVDITPKEEEIDPEEHPAVVPESLPEVAKPPSEHSSRLSD